MFVIFSLQIFCRKRDFLLQLAARKTTEIADCFVYPKKLPTLRLFSTTVTQLSKCTTYLSGGFEKFNFLDITEEKYI